MVFKFFKREKATTGRESEIDDMDALEPLAEPAVFANAADSVKDEDKLEIPVFLRRETEYKKDEDYLARLEQFKRELREKT
ncbi:hypothetical protein [Zymomonas mobilis]|uniref:hypothetical protein n=1 Tax=Zymomonas mobilis TaxID=542 RepID=UPI0039E8148B